MLRHTDRFFDAGSRTLNAMTAAIWLYIILLFIAAFGTGLAAWAAIKALSQFGAMWL